MFSMWVTWFLYDSDSDLRRRGRQGPIHTSFAFLEGFLISLAEKVSDPGKWGA